MSLRESVLFFCLVLLVMIRSPDQQCSATFFFFSTLFVFRCYSMVDSICLLFASYIIIIFNCALIVFSFAVSTCVFLCNRPSESL